MFLPKSMYVLALETRCTIICYKEYLCNNSIVCHNFCIQSIFRKKGNYMGLKDFLTTMVNPASKLPDAKEKPGSMCISTCPGLRYANTMCKGKCLPIQKRLEFIIHELEKMEETLNYTPEKIRKMNQRTYASYCSCCGAQYEKGHSSCPYCGKPYSAHHSAANVPESKLDRMKLYDRKIEEAWERVLDISDCQNKLVVLAHEKIFNGNKLLMAMHPVYTPDRKTLGQTAGQIKASAAHYKVPTSLFFQGFVTGEYKTIKQLQEAQAAKEAQERAAAQRQAYLNQLQNSTTQRTNTTRSSSLSSSQQTFWKIQQERASRPVGYNGGADRYCGNCMYWFNGHCASSDTSRSASEYCGCWKLK